MAAIAATAPQLHNTALQGLLSKAEGVPSVGTCQRNHMDAAQENGTRQAAKAKGQGLARSNPYGPDAASLRKRQPIFVSRRISLDKIFAI